MNNPVDVVVVGAGPVGLLLAIELGVGGADVLVLDRLAAPSTAIKGSSVGPLGAEALRRRNMGPALAEAEDRAFAARGPAGASMRTQALRSRGHFAALPLPAEPAREIERRMIWVDQQGIEAILSARAAALGVEVRRGCEVTGFEQGDAGVTVRWTSPEGADSVTCAWLAGCDGGRSVVRKMAGFDFPGAPASVTMYQALLDLDHPERLPRGATRTQAGVVMNGPRPRWLAMHDYSGPPADREAPVTREEIEAVLRRISGADVRVTAIDQANRFSDSARVVDSYRRDRVLLAGDAAHIHSPLGGQGLSLGLVDAANLGWKLAAVARGDKPENWLDSYTAERRPVAQAVLANTLAQIALSRQDPQSLALREMFARLLGFEAVAEHIAGLTSGLATRYDLGSARDEVGRLIGDRAIGGDGTSLFAAMGDGEGVLLDASSGGTASEWAAGFAGVRCVRVNEGPSMLIRPDGCIAWAGEDAPGLADALERWFAPRRRA
ncbi:MAG: FAD-dependent monooxygenase [Sphingobium sp.]|nr:FAD-dependent monooxygenase [Sphingobium sp.]